MKVRELVYKYCVQITVSRLEHEEAAREDADLILEDWLVVEIELKGKSEVEDYEQVGYDPGQYRRSWSPETVEELKVGCVLHDYEKDVHYGINCLRRATVFSFNGTRLTMISNA